MLIPVILAGGHGTRLAPVSTPDHPKPFLDLLDCGHTLFELTLLRAKQASDEQPIIIAALEHLELIQTSLETLQLETHILLEPCARNTAPAITCAARFAEQMYDQECQLLVLAADHYIADTEYFCDSVAKAKHQADTGNLVLFGIRPHSPETGYGYIEVNHHNQIIAFHEKPDIETAQSYLSSGRYLWNSGFFLLPSNLLLEEVSRLAPTVRDSCQAATSHLVELSDKVWQLAIEFSQSPAISIDYAVMEHSPKLALYKYDSKWSDLGTWQALYVVWPKNLQGIAHHSSLGLTLTPTPSGFQLTQNGDWLADV